eukprot:TRINITY_DN10949_c0_g1_i1.p4 TRINITY_DN10949_c0_g1~~TRINITY_DN10949_c0_g1_i1.p4  ORF type:complete len:105 (-),score=16.33 TRINITY_DN10949_c0_g1_i1:95-409(-)
MDAHQSQIDEQFYIPSRSEEAAKQAAKDAGKVKTELVQYRVRRGDNLTTISHRFGVTVSDLRRWNSLNSRGTIYAGQKLKVYVQQVFLRFRICPPGPLAQAGFI